MTRTLALCADDYGQAPHISAAILRLARARRLNAVSCLVNGASWQTDAPLLESLPPGIDIGLHFNLTEGKPLSPRLARAWPHLPSHPTLLLRCHLGLVSRAALRSEFHAQLRAFNEAAGSPPQYIDGHQHVHALPIVRTLLLDAAEHMRPVPAVRNTGCVLGPGYAFKRRVIELCGGRALETELQQRELAHNPTLLGVYDFVETDYRALMQGWLEQVPDEGAMLFCHPGDTAPEGSNDPIAAARVRERTYLESPAFKQDLADADVRLGAVWRVDEAVSGMSSDD